jgi:hypothetical protein
MFHKFHFERATLSRLNTDLNKFTTRKSYEIYRHGDTALLLEIWGYERGKGFAKFCRSKYELEDALARFAQRESLVSDESGHHRLIFDRGQVVEYPSFEDFSSMIRGSVNRDELVALESFRRHLDQEIGIRGDEIPRVSFKELWKLRAAAPVLDLEVEEAEEQPLVEAAYGTSWGEFA